MIAPAVVVAPAAIVIVVFPTIFIVIAVMIPIMVTIAVLLVFLPVISIVVAILGECGYRECGRKRQSCSCQISIYLHLFGPSHSPGAPVPQRSVPFFIVTKW